MNDTDNKFNSNTGTESALAYYRSVSADMNLFSFIINLAFRSDKVDHILKLFIDGDNLCDLNNIDDIIIDKEKPGNNTKIIRHNRQAILEMFVARLVDNFQKYLVDIIRQILRTKPEMLSTKHQQISLEDLLQHDDLESVIHEIIERKVNSLSYVGFAALDKWCHERGLAIELEEKERSRVVEAIGTRNIIVHNRCVVDTKYLQVTLSESIRIGEVRPLNTEYLFELLDLFNNIVTSTDRNTVRKFGLPVLEINHLAALHPSSPANDK